MAEYQNPQHEPGSERRLLLIFLITFVVMLAFQPLLKKYFPTPQTQQQQQPTQPAQTQTPAALPTPAPSASTAPAVTRQAAAETETVIENDLYKITFTNRGAQVKSWILKKFNNEAQNAPFDLVNPTAAAQFGFPLSLWTYDETLRGHLNSALFIASSEGKKTAPTSITFDYSDQDLTVHKTFSFDESYIVKVDTSVIYKGAYVTALPAWPSGFGDQTSPAFYATTMVGFQYNKNIERLPTRCGFSWFTKCKQVVGGDTIPGPFHWAGPSGQYFAAIFIPDDPYSVSMVTLNHPMEIPKDPQKDPKDTIKVDVVGAAVGNLHGPTSLRLFAGPKELQILQSVSIPGLPDGDLNGLVDYGTFGIIAKALFIWLRWTYNHIVPNWGWAIVLQTLIITVALLPLRITQMKSMLKMQRVAPQIKSIQEKYKKYSLRDPRKAKMNEEIAAIYKQEGVNPASGCLPMLPQLPILWAYYRMLSNALDLRHAHWLWIRDLSAADPLYLLPIIMVISSLLMQRMTPQAGMDPAQQRMMNVMMPLMMGFIFFKLAAGLNLYYAVVNVIQIGQQAIMNRTHLGKEIRAIMEKRARKKDKDK